MRKSLHNLLILLLLTFIMLKFPQDVFAHPSSQANVLAQSYHAKYKGYYIGGERVGWSIDERLHTNGTTITYSFLTSDPYLTNLYKGFVTTGASRWRGIVNIVNKTDGSGTGKISTYNDPESGVTAHFCEARADRAGHLTSWSIKINRAYQISATTLSHEFGHVIGLNDLYDESNNNKLMYGYSNKVVSYPTALDKCGAEVITGVHRSHTWGYQYYSTNSNGNIHAKYCTICNGLSLVKEPCTYNANRVCSKCGTPYGAQPFSIRNDSFHYDIADLLTH